MSVSNTYQGVKFVKVVKVQGGHLMVVKVVTLKVMDTLMVVKAPLISAPATCPQLPTASPPPEARGRTPGTMPRTTRKQRIQKDDDKDKTPLPYNCCLNSRCQIYHILVVNFIIKLIPFRS